MPRWLILAVGLFAMLAGPAMAQPRVALVVGVSNYVAAPALANPANDAADTAAALTRLGFETELLQDPDRNALEAAVRRFGGRARGADAAVFYYAGHALEVGGRNWLLPRTANISSDRDLRFEAVDADLVLEQVEGAARVTVVMLDSCRDNPFRARIGGGGRSAGGVGLAPPRAALGTLVAYSTAPGTTAEDGRGRNSPFTTALLRHVETPGLELRQLMGDVRRDVREATQGRQVPWEHSALEGAFYFKPPAPPAAPAAAPRPAGTNTEALFWDSMRGSTDFRDFQAYLEQFPDGTFARLARNKLAQLGHPMPLDTQEVAAALRRVVPPENATRGAGFFLAHPPTERAAAVNYGARGFYIPRGTSEGAEATRSLTLERCEVHYGSPCALAIEGETVLPAASTGEPWARRPMPRAAYRGRFDPEQVPGRSAAGRRDPALLEYAAATGPKAAAYHAASARFYGVTDGAAEAAARALQRCMEDPQRPANDGTCYLYALGDEVVLPQRLRVAPRMAASAAPPARAPAPSARLTREQVQAALTPLIGGGAASEARGFDALQGHRALAFNPQRRLLWRTADSVYRDARDAEEAALEGCQILYHSPCALLAAAEALRPAPAAEQAWPVRDMPRTRYAGRFSPEQIPTIFAPIRTGVAVQGYAAHAGAKAAAFHPWASGFVPVIDAPTEAEAAERALRRCNENPGRPAAGGPCFLYALGDNVVLPQRLTAPPAPPAPPQPTRLTAAQMLAAWTPLIGEAAARSNAAAFDGAAAHRAAAINPAQRGGWNAGGFAIAAEVEEAVLERCQVYYGSPCAVFAAGEAIRPAPASAQPWPLRDMPRVRHAGRFSPADIPGLSSGARAAPNLRAYAEHRGAKAAAYHPWAGVFTPVITAASETAAAEEALRLCNDDPQRRGLDGPCFLYALGDNVVLPQRLRAAPPPPAPPPPVPAAQAPAPAVATPGRLTTAQIMAILTPLLGEDSAASNARIFEGSAPPRALAINSRQRGGYASTGGYRDAADAGEGALERCQIFYNTPCALITAGETLQPAPPPGQPWPLRDMPRARHAGNFDPQQLPGTGAARREAAAVLNYGIHTGPKAAAYHSWGGGFFPVTTAATETAAAEQALRACNDNPERAGRNGPCFLYALGNRVVLPQRLTQPPR